MPDPGPVAAAVAAIDARHPDLDHPDPVLRDLEWEAWRLELRRFLEDLALHAAVGFDAVVEHAYRAANASFAHRAAGGPWWAFLAELGARQGAVDVLIAAEEILGAGEDE